MRYINKIAVLILLLTTSSAFAANQCISEMQQGKRTQYGDELNLKACDLTDSDIPAVVNYLQNHHEISFALDLDKNPKLTQIGTAQLGNISTVNAISFDSSKLGDAAIIAFTRTNKSFTYVSVTDNNISDKSIIELANNNKITWLQSSKAHVTSIGARALAHSTSIDTIDMNDVPSLGDDGAIELFKGHFKILALYGDNIGPRGLQTFKNDTIKELFVGNNRIGNNFNALALDPYLNILDLSNNQITDISIFKKNQNLSELYLRNNKIVEIESIAQHPKLHLVSLNSNLINDVNLKSLERNTALSILEINHNQIKNAGALILAKLNLADLDVSYNHIGKDGIAALKAKYGDRVNTDGNDGNQRQLVKKLISPAREHWVIR